MNFISAMVMLLDDEGWCTFVLVENEVYRVIVCVCACFSPRPTLSIFLDRQSGTVCSVSLTCTRTHTCWFR